MSYIIASQILLWLGLILLGAICIALARQVGVLHERIAPAGALILPRADVSIGSEAPRHRVQTINGDIVDIGGPRGARSQLLFFLAPDCPICKRLLPVLRSIARAEGQWLDIVLASDGGDADHAGFVRANQLERFDYVLSEPLGRSFSVSKLPYGVLIDEHGRIASLGLINTREHLESLFEAKERGVSSLQDFLSQRAAARS